MMDLIYGPVDIQETLKKKYPDAVFEDARDYVHKERFEFRTELEEGLSDSYIEFMLREGVARNSLNIGLEIQMHPERVMRILTKMKTDKMEAEKKTAEKL